MNKIKNLKESAIQIKDLIIKESSVTIKDKGDLPKFEDLEFFYGKDDHTNYLRVKSKTGFRIFFDITIYLEIYGVDRLDYNGTHTFTKGLPLIRSYLMSIARMHGFEYNLPLIDCSLLFKENYNLIVFSNEHILTNKDGEILREYGTFEELYYYIKSVLGEKGLHFAKVVVTELENYLVVHYPDDRLFDELENKKVPHKEFFERYSYIPKDILRD